MKSNWEEGKEENGGVQPEYLQGGVGYDSQYRATARGASPSRSLVKGDGKLVLMDVGSSTDLDVNSSHSTYHCNRLPYWLSAEALKGNITNSFAGCESVAASGWHQGEQQGGNGSCASLRK